MVLEEGFELRMLGEVGVIRSELRVLAQVTIDLRMFVKKLVERLDLPGRNVTTPTVPTLFLRKTACGFFRAARARAGVPAAAFPAPGWSAMYFWIVQQGGILMNIF